MNIGQKISDFFTSLVDWIKYVLDYLVGLFSGIMSSIVYYAKLVLNAISNPVFDLLQGILDNSGLTAKVAFLHDAFSGPLGYFADFFMIPAALTSLGGAYLIRFLIRRIPVIG
jgi:hypothetical protein